MSCTSPYATHHLGCACHEADWAARLESERALRERAEMERDAWIETARMHAKNEDWYRGMIDAALAGVPEAFVADDGSVHDTPLRAKFPEILAAEREAHEETRRERDAQTEIARATLRSAEELGARLAAAEEALRHAARELVYVHMHEPVGGPDLVHTSEGDACIALAEKLLGPMATWPDEPSAQSAFLAGGNTK